MSHFFFTPFFLTLLLFLAGCDSTSTDMLPNEVEIGKSFILKTDLSASVASKIGKKLDKAVLEYEEFMPFESKRKRRFKVLIFKERETYREHRDKMSPAKSEFGYYVPMRGELGVPYQGMDRTLRVLYHEVFHAYFEDRIIHPPAWLNEGLAEFAETLPFGLLSQWKKGAIDDQWVGILRQSSSKDRIPFLGDLVRQDWPERHNLSKEQYAISWSLAHFFLKTNDDEVRKQFEQYLQLLYDKKNPQSAFEEVWPDARIIHDKWIKHIKTTLVKKFFLF